MDASLVSAIALAATLGFVPGVAHSEEAPAAPAAAAAADGEGGLQQIVVTAQKRPENLQKTPISISVLKGDDLTNRHAQSLLDLGDGAIPSLRVAPFFSRQSALIINVRGIGVLSDSNQPARDQGVGVYIDGVYQGRPQALGAALFDIENIEVLKGPQGTLFGRNTEGGAVNIVTRKPSGKFHMNSTFGAGNWGSYKAETHIDLPEFANLSVKLDGIITRRDGTVHNPQAGANDFNSYDRRGFHGEVLWKPSATFSADYSYALTYDATTSLYEQQVAPGAYTLAVATPLQPNRVDVAAVGGPEQPSVGKTFSHRLNLQWQAMPNLTLKSITAYSELTQSQFDNGSIAASFNSVPAGASFVNVPFQRYSLAGFRQNQVSEELQAIGEVPTLKYAFGALYYQERVQDNAVAFFDAAFTDATGSMYQVLNLDPASKPYQRASYVKTTSKGVYGQATYTPAVADDIAHLTLGLRYTNDKKDGSLFIVNGVAPSPPGYPANTPIPLAYSKSRVDPLINLAIDASRDVHLYGKWSTGYRSGGANSRSLTYASFNPETVSMFEVGAKTEFLDHHARFNIAAYTGAYKNIQLDFSGLYQQLINGVLVNTTRTTTNTVNAPGTGRLKGVEAELTLVPLTGLSLSASYAYNQVKIPATLNPFPASNGLLVTVPVPIYQVYTPENSASGAIDYETPVNGLTLRLHLDANYDSGFYVNYTDAAYDPVTHLPTYLQPKGDKAFVVNGRVALADIGLGDSGGKMTVAFWARNVFNEQHLFYKSGAPTSGVVGFFNDPRTFGGEVNIRF
jgi:iron complex outermembrane receptor protein